MKAVTRIVLSSFLPALICVALPTAGHASLTGWWKLDEGAGDSLADSSSSGTTGTIFNAGTGGLGPGGSVWLNDPQRGTVLSFNGEASGAYARVGEIPQMTLTNDFTWAFWGNQDVGNTTPNDIIFGNRMDENAVDFVPRQFIKFTPTKFEWHMNGNGNDNLEYDDLPAGEWIHHAVVKQADQLTYYRNGTEANSGMITQALDFPQPLFLGGDNEGSAGENWRGMLSDVQIYDHPLTPMEVIDAMNAMIDVPLPGDVDGDDDVDLDDFEIIRLNFRQLVPAGESGDLNRDGIVDFADFRDWKNHYVPGVVPNSSNIPEPSGIALAALLTAIVGASRPRRASHA